MIYDIYVDFYVWDEYPCSIDLQTVDSWILGVTSHNNSLNNWLYIRSVWGKVACSSHPQSSNVFQSMTSNDRERDLSSLNPFPPSRTDAERTLEGLFFLLMIGRQWRFMIYVELCVWDEHPCGLVQKQFKSWNLLLISQNIISVIGFLKDLGNVGYSSHLEA